MTGRARLLCLPAATIVYLAAWWGRLTPITDKEA